MTKRFYYESDFAPGQKVYIGEDDTLIGVVVGVLWHSSDPTVQVSWVNSGSVYTQWLHPCLLRDASGHELSQ